MSQWLSYNYGINLDGLFNSLNIYRENVTSYILSQLTRKYIRLRVVIYIYIYASGGQEHWDNLHKVVVIMEAIEKQANKKYDQLQVHPTSAQSSRLLNEMEVTAFYICLL